MLLPLVASLIYDSNIFVYQANAICPCDLLPRIKNKSKADAINGDFQWALGNSVRSNNLTFRMVVPT